MSYQVKYVHKLREQHSGKGRKANPENWTEETKIQRDQYYALLKHRAQAKFRGESHSLTPEQWYTLWADGRWFDRGRDKHDLCLVQKNPLEGWHVNNVEVVTRMDYLRRQKEYRDLRRDQDI